MIEFIDKMGEQNGTPLNRANLMAIQGFEAVDITFPDKLTIVETNSKGQTLTIKFMQDCSIEETFVGEKTIKKKTTFSKSDITEIIEEIY